MAMTPVYNEVNRIQVGNPVPIGGSESARAFNETQEALGKAIFDLGNALDNDHKKTNYEPLARKMADELEIQMLQNSQRIKGTSPMDDRDGVDHSNQVFASVEDMKQEQLKIIPDEAKPLYEQYVAAAKVQHVGTFMQTGAQASIDKKNSVLVSAMNTISDKAINDPNNLDIYLTQAAISVEESDVVLESQKDTRVQTEQANIVQRVIEKYRQDGVRTSDGKYFDTARYFAKKYDKLLSKDVFSKQMAEINNEQYEAKSRSRGDIDWNRKNSDYIEAKDQADQTVKLSDAFAKAKTPAEKLQVEKLALGLLNNKKITIRQYEDAKQFRQSLDRFVDAGFESKIINQLVQEKGAISIAGKKTAVQQINEAYQKNGGITAQKHSELILLAEKLRDDKGMNRERLALVKEYMDVINTYNQNSITALSDEKMKLEKARTSALIQTNFLEAVLKQPAKSVGEIYESTVPSQLGIGFSKQQFNEKHIPGLPESGQATPENIQRNIPYLKEDLLNAVKSGDAARIRAATEALNKANRQVPKGSK